MIKVDHSKTDAALDRITAAFHSQVELYSAYMKKKDDSKDQAMYSAQYLEGLADKALEALVARAKKNQEIFDKAIEDAEACEEKNQEAIDFTDPTLQGILAALQILKKDDPLVDMKGLTSTGRLIEAALAELKGQRNALELIRQTLAQKGISILKQWEVYFYGDDLFSKLDLALTALTNSPGAATLYLTARDEIQKVADTLGLTLRKSDLALDSLGDGFYMEGMRSVMGL